MDYEDLLYGRKALASETELSVSGGTEQTRYYVSGLVKNDPGIALSSGYKKQGFRVNLDQALGSRFNVGVSTNVMHSRADRALSNNDNTGTSPGLVLPFTPSFFDPRADSAGRLPGQSRSSAATRCRPFSLLTNKEDVWRALGTVTTKLGRGDR